jgi:hypothetical protein
MLIFIEHIIVSWIDPGGIDGYILMAAGLYQVGGNGARRERRYSPRL